MSAQEDGLNQAAGGSSPSVLGAWGKPSPIAASQWGVAPSSPSSPIDLSGNQTNFNENQLPELPQDNTLDSAFASFFPEQNSQPFAEPAIQASNPPSSPSPQEIPFEPGPGDTPPLGLMPPTWGGAEQADNSSYRLGK